MKAAVCELPAQLDVQGESFKTIAKRIRDESIDLLVLNELPFGPWLPRLSQFDREKAEAWIATHEVALPSLRDLARVVISSRPVVAGDRLANEAFAFVDGVFRPLHDKQYFPDEEGFYEARWFQPRSNDFDVHELGDTRVGVQLCSEIMFNEWSRRYGRSGAQIIAVPRTSGVSTAKWQTGLAMAAITSGCYVLSSNRRGTDEDSRFGGSGFIYAPGGEQIAATTAEDPIAFVELDFGRVASAQADWPCNVSELRSP